MNSSQSSTPTPHKCMYESRTNTLPTKGTSSVRFAHAPACNEPTTWDQRNKFPSKLSPILSSTRNFLTRASNLTGRILASWRSSDTQEHSLCHSTCLTTEKSLRSVSHRRPSSGLPQTYPRQSSVTPTAANVPLSTPAVNSMVFSTVLEGNVSKSSCTTSLMAPRPIDNPSRVRENGSPDTLRQQYSSSNPSSSASSSPSSSTKLKSTRGFSLQSPRGLLRSIVPSRMTQNTRMDILLLHDAPALDEIRRAAWNGCTPQNRLQAWRMLMAYEPVTHSLRYSTLQTKRAQYRHYVKALYAPLGEVRFDCSSAFCKAKIGNIDVYDIDSGECDDGSNSIASFPWNLPSDVQPVSSSIPISRGRAEILEDQMKESTSDKAQHRQSFPAEQENRDVPCRIIRPTVEYSSFSAKILREIEMDLPRTHPDLPVFHIAAVRNTMRRVLYVFGILNPVNNYVQGLNEILTPIVAVLLMGLLPRTIDRSPQIFLNPDNLNGRLVTQQWADSEADAFWMFSAIVEAICDNFTADQPGIFRRIVRLEEIVGLVDPTLAAHLSKNGIHFLQFSFRWMNCLLVRELPLHLVVKLWDALLAKPDGIADLHVYVCAALLVKFSTQLKRMDFEQCMLLLQKLPTKLWSDEDVDELLSQALIWKETLGLQSLASL